MSEPANSGEDRAASRPGSFSKPRAWLELFRLPNVFTALADVGMGFAFTHEGLHDWPSLALLLASSALLYTAGMVLNDVFDVAIDARERPFRPLPSGRIEVRWARMIGVQLLLVGVACGWGAGSLVGSWRSGVVASALAGLVVAYDGGLKRTPLGPFAMGGCRALNVLLGMSATSSAWERPHLAVAIGLGVYIVGVTWFARTEAVESRRASLAGASLVIAIGLAGVMLLPVWDNAIPTYAPRAHGLGAAWYAVWGMLGFVILRRCLRAVWAPSPAMVQFAVKNCIWSLIILDAVVAVAARGPAAGMAIVALLIPTAFLGRWIYST